MSTLLPALSRFASLTASITLTLGGEELKPEPAASADDLTPPRVLSDFIKAPAAGTGIFKRGNDDTIEVILTFITLDFSRKKAKALETSVRTSVSMRNKAIP